MEEKDNNEDEINTSSQPLLSGLSSENIEESIDQDNVQVKLQEITAEFTNVSSVLSLSHLILDEKEHFDIVKLSIKVKAVYNYSWVVYKLTSEIKKNCSDILSELGKKGIQISDNNNVIFQTVNSWGVESIKLHIVSWII